MKLHLKIRCYKLRKLRLKFMEIRTILYQYIKTLIKHVFLLNFTHELLMSFRMLIQKPLVAPVFNTNNAFWFEVCYS